MSGIRPTRAARVGRGVVVVVALLWSLGPVLYGVLLAGYVLLSRRTDES